MDHDTLWGHIHHERDALAATLRTLTPEQWEHDSLCVGWTVKDVAAHVISSPQMGIGRTMGLFGRNLGRGYNTDDLPRDQAASERQTTSRSSPTSRPSPPRASKVADHDESWSR